MRAGLVSLSDAGPVLKLQHCLDEILKSKKRDTSLERLIHLFVLKSHIHRDFGVTCVLMFLE